MTSHEERKDIIIKIFTGAGLRLTGFILTRLLGIIRIIVFARLFLPDELGTAILATSCIAIATIFTNFGFYQSVIRYKDGPTDFIHTAFTLSVIIGSVVFLLTLIGAPFFSLVFSKDLDKYIIFLAFLAFAVPLKFPTALWEKNLKFKQPIVASLIGECAILIISIFTEYFFHVGIWSLLIGNLGGFFISVIYIWCKTDYCPKLTVKHEHTKPLFSFGTPLMLQSMNGEVMARGDNLMVGAFWSSTQLAYYNFAWQVPMLISSLTASVDSILLPVYARLNNDRIATLRLFNLSNKMWSITGSFLGFFIFLYCEEIVHIIYGPNWKPVVPILQIMTISFVIRFCSGYSYDNLVLVRGRTKYMMKWGFVNTILVFTLGLYLIKKMGPIGGAWFWLIQSIILIPLVRLPLIYHELQSFEFIRHVWQPFFSGLVALFFSYMLKEHIQQSIYLNLGLGIVVYGFIYCATLFFCDKNLITDARKIINIVKTR